VLSRSLCQIIVMDKGQCVCVTVDSLSGSKPVPFYFGKFGSKGSNGDR
jgi:hypothetical protein